MNLLQKLSPDRMAFKLALSLTSSRNPPHRGDEQPRSILVGITTFLGDMLMSAPLIAALKRRHPDAWLTVLVRPEYRELAACIHGVDALIEERHSWRWLREQRRLDDGGYDWGIVALESRILPLMAALGARKITAYPDPKGRHASLIDDPVAFPVDKPRHLARLLLHLVGAEDENLAPPYLDVSGLPLPGEMPSTPFVIIHCGARSALRRWSPDRYRTVAATCIEQGCRVVLTGTAEDGPAIERIKRDLPNDKLLDMSGRTTLPQLARLVGHAALVVGPDTGVLHLAKALGRPAAIIMGQGQLELFGPDALYAQAAYFSVDHLPCRDKHTIHGQHAEWINTCSRRSCSLQEPQCQTGIEAGLVAAEIRKLLGGQFPSSEQAG